MSTRSHAVTRPGGAARRRSASPGARPIRRCALAALIALALLLPVAAGAQLAAVGERGTFAIRNGTVVTANGAEIANGTVVIEDGRISAVGADVTVPAGARIIDASGLRVYPGMMDAGTSLGLAEITQGANATVDLNELGDFNPHARAIAAVHPHSAHFGVSRVVGVTSAVTMPRGGVIAGQAAVINLAGSAPAEMAVQQTAGLVVTLPRTGGGGGGFGGGGSGQPPRSPQELARQREQQLGELRAMLRDARAYARAHEAHAADRSLPRPAVDVALASLVPYARGERPVLFHADRAADIREAITFAREMELRPVIIGGADAWRVTDLLRRHDVPVIITSVLSLPMREDDPYDVHFANAARLHEAGVRFCISTGSAGASVRDLPYHAGMASAFGLPRDEALRAVTLYPAHILGVADRIGSIEVGKIANLVVTDGDLLEARTNTRYLFIDGRPIELTSRHERLYEEFRRRGASTEAVVP